MRICLVTTEYPPGPMGGVGTYSMILPPLLQARGHELVLLTKRFGDSPACAVEDGIEVHRLSHEHPWTGDKDKEDDELFAAEMCSLRSYVGVFAREVSRKIAELHAEKPFDIVLTQDVEAPTWLAQDRRMVFDDLDGLPFVNFVHSPHWQIQYYNEDSQYERHEYHRWLYEKQSLVQADGLIAASQSMQDEIIQQLGLDKRKVTRIPLPLGPVPKVADFSQRLGNEELEERRIVYSGRIELRKGVETLLRAVIPLLEHDPRVTLHLLGRDMPHPTIGGTVSEVLTRRVIPEAFRDRIVFRGWTPREQLWAEYAKATVGVIPSPWEPFSFVCQEMMACGCTVVATKTGGMADMIENGRSGLLCAPNSVESLRGSLAKALSAPPQWRKSWGDAAAKRIRSFCDNDAIADATVRCFEQVIEQSQKTRQKHGRFPIPGCLPFGEKPAKRKRIPSITEPIRKPAIIIPFYNLQEFLPDCLESIRKQTFRDFQAFIIDDGSTDPASLPALQAAAREKNVRVIQTQNGGLPVARNRGAQAALAEGCDALMFLDADDWIEPTYLEKAVDVLNRHPEAGAVTSWTNTVGMMRTYWAPPHPQFPFLLAECMSTPPALIRSKAFEAVGGVGEEFKYAFEDWDFWVTLCEAGYAMLMIPEPLINYRMRVGSMSRMFRTETREHGRLRMVERHRDLITRYAGDLMLLQDGFRYSEEESYHDIKAKVARMDIDLQWNMKEWRHFKKLYDDECARHEQTKTALKEAQEQVKR